MKIAILGSNPRAEAIGRLLADSGYHIWFGDAEGLTPGSQCDMLIFAGPRERVDDLLAQAGGISPETIVVDAMEGKLPGSESGPELLARKLDTRRVVRAVIMAPQAGANILYCGDDADATTTVEEVFRTVGCLTTNRGPLANAAKIEAPPNAAGESSFETLRSANTVGSS